MSEELLTFEELKTIIPGLNRTSLWRWMKSGRFPLSRQLGPRRVVWLKSEIMKWMKDLSVVRSPMQHDLKEFEKSLKVTPLRNSKNI